MRHVTSEAGSTLVEAVVAAALLVTVATGTATLILLGHQMGQRTEQSIAATSLAAARLESLAAVAWEYDLGGGAPVVQAMAVTPGDALDQNLADRSETTDEAGRVVGSPGAESPRFVVRWAVWSVPTAMDARAIEVCVFRWPGATGAMPLTCLASARVRQP
jgi:hypothetical protein